MKDKWDSVEEFKAAMAEATAGARRAQAKAAFEYWLSHIRDIWRFRSSDRSWDQLNDSERESWSGLCDAETDAFMTYWAEAVRDFPPMPADPPEYEHDREDDGADDRKAYYTAMEIIGEGS